MFFGTIKDVAKEEGISIPTSVGDAVKSIGSAVASKKGLEFIYGIGAVSSPYLNANTEADKIIANAESTIKMARYMLDPKSAVKEGITEGTRMAIRYGTAAAKSYLGLGETATKDELMTAAIKQSVQAVKAQITGVNSQETAQVQSAAGVKYTPGTQQIISRTAPVEKGLIEAAVESLSTGFFKTLNVPENVVNQFRPVITFGQEGVGASAQTNTAPSIKYTPGTREPRISVAANTGVVVEDLQEEIGETKHRGFIPVITTETIRAAPNRVWVPVFYERAIKCTRDFPDIMKVLLDPEYPETRSGQVRFLDALSDFVRFYAKKYPLETDFQQVVLQKMLASYFVFAGQASLNMGSYRSAITFKILKSITLPQGHDEHIVSQSLENYAYKRQIYDNKRILMGESERKLGVLNTLIENPVKLSEFIDKLTPHIESNYRYDQLGRLIVKERMTREYVPKTTSHMQIRPIETETVFRRRDIKKGRLIIPGSPRLETNLNQDRETDDFMFDQVKRRMRYN